MAYIAELLQIFSRPLVQMILGKESRHWKPIIPAMTVHCLV